LKQAADSGYEELGNPDDEPERPEKLSTTA
jgi:hypothetical protein